MFGSWFGRVFLNFLGAAVRWMWGTVWRTLFNKPKFKWSEYLYGPENPEYYDTMGHEFNNKMIGIFVLIFIIVPIIELFFG